MPLVAPVVRYACLNWHALSRVNDGVVTIQFWDSSTQKLRKTTRSHMHFCWRGNMFTLAKSRTTHTDNRTVTVHTDYAPQYGQCTVNVSLAQSCAAAAFVRCLN